MNKIISTIALAILASGLIGIGTITTGITEAFAANGCGANGQGNSEGKCYQNDVE
jgi:hypothetical protein